MILIKKVGQKVVKTSKNSPIWCCFSHF